MIKAILPELTQHHKQFRQSDKYYLQWKLSLLHSTPTQRMQVSEPKDYKGKSTSRKISNKPYSEREYTKQYTKLQNKKKNNDFGQPQAEATTRGEATLRTPYFLIFPDFLPTAPSSISFYPPQLYLQSGRNHHFLWDMELVTVSQGRDHWGTLKLVSNLGPPTYKLGDLATQPICTSN